MAKTTEIFDLRESIVPFSLLQISNRFKTMNPGEYIEVIGSDEAITKDIKSILAKFEYEVQYVDTPDTKTPDFCIRLRKVKK
jgi:TusA-related sulfurtransferase